MADRKKTGKGEPYLYERQEVEIRGFWDRYSKDSQEARRRRKYYAHIPDELNQGPTAYDKLVATYNSMSAFEKRHAILRVAYGINPLTQKQYTDTELAELDVFLPVEKQFVYETIRNLMVRAGVVDTPTEWKKSRKRKRREKAFHGTPVPIGLEWWVDPNQ